MRILAALAAAMLGGLGPVEAADAASPAIGPFTQNQVTAGRNAFLTHCSGCHGPYLLGNSGPPLAGAPFLEDWAGKSTGQLFRFASSNMPLNAAGTLPEDTYLNLVAFILAVNGARPGAAAFAGDSDVRIGSIVSGNLAVTVLRGEEDGGERPR
jgi:mono/diheme cytochrome c family protein